MMTTVFIMLAVVELLFAAGALGRTALARLAGMRVEAIVLGFGPPVARWGKLQLAAVPLGAFCRVAGLDPCEAPVPTGDRRAFHNRPLPLRLLVALGWPIGVQVLVAAFVAGLALLVGVPRTAGTTEIVDVAPGSPANSAGLRAGDEVLSVDGQSVDFGDFVRRIDRSEGRAVTIAVRRADRVETVTVSPGLDEGRYRLGVRIGPKMIVVRPGVAAALALGARYPFDAQKRIIGDFIELVSRRIEAEVVGPVGVASTLRQLDGSAAVARRLAHLGAYIVLLALLPIPPLPGARFWMVLFGWRGPRARSHEAARDAGPLELPRPRFPAALLAALFPLSVYATVDAYHAVGGELGFAALAIVPLLLLAALARGWPRAWSVGVLAPVLFVGPAETPLLLAIRLGMPLAVFATLHLPPVRRYFGLACPVCARVAARPVPASRRTACMACGSTWIARR